MKRILKVVLVIVWSMTGLWAGWNAPADAAPSRLDTHAEAAALVDVTSGRLLYSEHGDQQMRIASLTKIMTAIVAIEQGKLSDQVKVSRNAYRKEGSSIYLKLGETMSLKDMLYGLMLRSGNDAATAIAEHVGGSEKGFVLLMNEKAKELGMDHSHFMNPSGLDDDGHYSTANDMAKLTAYALKNPVFREIVKTEVKRAPSPGDDWDRIWNNKNKMLKLYDGADGVKTGYTKLAKRCLVSSATRDGQQLAAVTLNDSDDWADHSRMLDYGFGHFKLTTLISKGDPVESGFAAGRTFTYAFADGEADQVTTRTEWNGQSSVEYRLGDAGRLQFLLDGKIIGSVPLYAADNARLQKAEQSAFSFKGTNLTRDAAFMQDWKEVFRSLFRALFNGKG